MTAAQLGTRLSDDAVRRWAWVTFGFFLASILTSIGFLFADTTSVDDWGFSGNVGDVLFGLMITLFPLVGLLITRRQPRNRIGWLLLAVGMAWALPGIVDAYVQWALVLHPGSLPWGYEMEAVDSALWMPPMVLMGIFVILLFPDGRLPSPRWRPVAWLGVVVGVVGTLAIIFAPGSLDDVPVPADTNPLGIESAETLFGVLLVVTLPLLPLCILASACALVQRFRRSHGVERLQLKWLTTAGAFVAVAFLVTMAVSLPSAFQSESSGFHSWVLFLQSTSILSFGLIPIAIGIAVTRHGLYGIDAIISKALVFGALGVFVTVVYVAIVVGVGAAAGQGDQPSVVLSVLATAVVAVAFQPVRERVHRVANRLVYGARSTPYEVLSDFASRMTGTYTTGELLPQMARTVSECLGGARVEVWLRSGGELAREVSWPTGGIPTMPVLIGDDDTADLPGDRVVPVRHHGKLLGMIAVTKAAGEQVTPTEDKMLDAVASQAGLVLRNVRLIDDLRGSRERLVAAQDVERRRLERNLHDGAQQSLVSVALLLRMAAARVTDEQMKASLAEASAQLQHAIEELRELARGIHPAILTERGLGPALTSLAERSPVPVRVELALAERPPATVEGTLYFVVAEALTNVARYAGATTASVTLAQDGDVITAEVSDDGVGGADPAHGSGLRGLTDRVAAVDGSFEVDSPPGQGTRVTCRVPVSAARAAVLEPA